MLIAHWCKIRHRLNFISRFQRCIRLYAQEFSLRFINHMSKYITTSLAACKHKISNACSFGQIVWGDLI